MCGGSPKSQRHENLNAPFPLRTSPRSRAGADIDVAAVQLEAAVAPQALDGLGLAPGLCRSLLPTAWQLLGLSSSQVAARGVTTGPPVKKGHFTRIPPLNLIGPGYMRMASPVIFAGYLPHLCKASISR